MTSLSRRQHDQLHQYHQQEQSQQPGFETGNRFSRILRILQVFGGWLLIQILFSSTTTAAAAAAARRDTSAQWQSSQWKQTSPFERWQLDLYTLRFPRGGGNDNEDNINGNRKGKKPRLRDPFVSPSPAKLSVEEYVAAVEERDASARGISKDEQDNNDDTNQNVENSSPAEFSSASSFHSSNHPAEDDESRNSESEKSAESTPSSSEASSSPATAAAVGVKVHAPKKSNAVGDPDGEGSDNDDDDDDDDDEEEVDGSNDKGVHVPDNADLSENDWDDFDAELMNASEVQVELELLEKQPEGPLVETMEETEEGQMGDDNEFPSTDTPTSVTTTTTSSDSTTTTTTITEIASNSLLTGNKNSGNAAGSGGSGGGVGILSHRLGRRRNQGRKGRKEPPASPGVAVTTPRIEQSKIHQAWNSFVYFPPIYSAASFASSKFGGYLKENARLLEGASKSRLDRRTLYACLMMEWLHVSATYRKFLESSTSQQLQAALSMATQPQWRRSFPRSNGIRLYDPTDEVPNRGCTLAMQESIALALAHSFGAGMVVLDDTTLLSIRQRLVSSGGYSEEEVRPAAIIEALFVMAREGYLTQQKGAGMISTCMKRDLALGLDDPYDERAIASCKEMADWESNWMATDSTANPLTMDEESDNKNDTKQKKHRLPLVIFVPVEGSTGLLKSKSVMELLLHECNSSDGTNLIVLGKGINAKTTSIPPDPVHDEHGNNPGGMSSSRTIQGSQPFGFSPNSQNASGQNDPEGSRRFNIFLARTVDGDGNGGIIGAIAPPQAGNLFPHMIAMQARDQLQPKSAPAKDDLDRWARQFQQHMLSIGGTSLPPPQFFNATLSSIDDADDDAPSVDTPPPDVIQETLQQTMGALLDRLAQATDENDGSMGVTPNLQRAFSQVLRNEALRRGIAENLARAAPALSDPKCQGVMLSVYVPPPPQQLNRGKFSDITNASNKPSSSMGGWFQKILNSQEGAGNDDEETISKMQKRVRTMAAAAAVLAAKSAQEAKQAELGSKADRNLSKIESRCRPIVVRTPADPVRAKSWEAWINRERGAVIFRQNRRKLQSCLHKNALALQEHVGTRGAGSSLRQMLSVRVIGDEMEKVIIQAVELEAAKSQRQHETPSVMHENEATLEVDITLSQLLLRDDGIIEDEIVESENVGRTTNGEDKDKSAIQFIHPSSLESALSSVCKISPSPSGGVSISGSNAAHRSREEIVSLAQDKHERALISQVVSPQDIGVTYDMIGGLTEVKELLRQSITYPLKFPHLYNEGIAREAVKGVLLFGPPGTGKTMLAKAVATEGGASFLSVDASSVENKWLGESEKNAKAVFTLARRLAPCVIFVDEVDSLLSSREGGSDDSAHGTLTSVKTTMMSEWDGLNSGTNGAGESGSDRVVVIGSTNRPFDLDEAVLRRFPRRILVDLPDLETRAEILEVTLAENRLDPAVNLTLIAERLEGYTGSDIKEVCREAVVQISHEQAKLLDQGLLGSNSREDVTQGSLQRLRPVTVNDFDKALSKLKRSVSETGKELARVWEWNDEYGEIKKERRNLSPHLANMYL